MYAGTAGNTNAKNHRDWLTKSGWQHRDLIRNGVLLGSLVASDYSNIHQGGNTHEYFDIHRMII